MGTDAKPRKNKKTFGVKEDYLFMLENKGKKILELKLNNLIQWMFSNILWFRIFTTEQRLWSK